MRSRERERETAGLEKNTVKIFVLRARRKKQSPLR